MKAIKRMYVDVVINGEKINLSVRANTGEEARAKLPTLYKGISEILDVKETPPRQSEQEEVRSPKVKQRKGYGRLWSGGEIMV